MQLAPQLSQETLEVINEVGVRAMRDRSERLGDKEGGLYGYYRSLLDAGRALQEYEVRVANLLLAQIEVQPVVEVGSGWGFMSAALALSGLRVYSVERDRARANAQAAFIQALQKERPELEGRVTTLCEAFPDIDGAVPRRARLVFTNLVFTTSPQERQRIIAGMRAYSAGIFDALRFFGQYYQEGGIDESLRDFRAAGHRPRLMLALSGGGGMYYAICSTSEA